MDTSNPRFEELKKLLYKNKKNKYKKIIYKIAKEKWIHKIPVTKNSRN